MKENGILYCWSRNTVFFFTIDEALFRYIGISLASRVVSVTIVMSDTPPFSPRVTLLWM